VFYFKCATVELKHFYFCLISVWLYQEALLIDSLHHYCTLLWCWVSTTDNYAAKEPCAKWAIREQPSFNFCFISIVRALAYNCFRKIYATIGSPQYRRRTPVVSIFKQHINTELFRKAHHMLTFRSDIVLLVCIFKVFLSESDYWERVAEFKNLMPQPTQSYKERYAFRQLQ